MKISNQNSTLCTGLWFVKENIKRDLDHYLESITKTFSMLKNQNIVFFYDDSSFLEIVKKNISNNNLRAINLHIEDLPTFI